MARNSVDARFQEEEAYRERLEDELIKLNNDFCYCSLEDWDIKDLEKAIKQEKELELLIDGLQDNI